MRKTRTLLIAAAAGLVALAGGCANPSPVYDQFVDAADGYMNGPNSAGVTYEQYLDADPRNAPGDPEREARRRSYQRPVDEFRAAIEAARRERESR